MILDAEGELTDVIRLEDKFSKGKSGGVVYISTRLKEALADLLVISRPIGTTLKTKEVGQVILYCCYDQLVLAALKK